jgi:hypothetical protein
MAREPRIIVRLHATFITLTSAPAKCRQTAVKELAARCRDQLTALEGLIGLAKTIGSPHFSFGGEPYRQ